MGGVAHRRHLLHQRLVDMEPAGGVEDEHVVAFAPSPGRARARAMPTGRSPSTIGRVATSICAAEHGELLLRRRALHVERGHQHLLALAALEEPRELGRGRGLARALQPDHHHDDRRHGVEIEPGLELAAERLDQMVVDDLHHHLRRRDRAQHLLPDRLGAHAVDEILDHRQRDIGLEQRHADLAQRRRHVLLAERAAAAPAGRTRSVRRWLRLSNMAPLQNPTGQCATLADWPSPRQRGRRRLGRRGS